MKDQVFQTQAPLPESGRMEYGPHWYNVYESIWQPHTEISHRNRISSYMLDAGDAKFVLFLVV